MLPDFTEEEEEQNGVEVSAIDGGRGSKGGRFGLEMEGKVVEGGEEVASDEEGLLGKRQQVEAVQGEREERWGREHR